MANNKQKKEKSLINTYGFPILLFVVVMAYAISSYGIKMGRKIKGQVFDSYIDELASIVEIYNQEIYSIRKVADFISKQLENADNDELFSDTTINALKCAAEITHASNAYVVLHDYSAIDIKGNKYGSIIDLPGFADAIKEIKTYSKLTTNSDGERTFLIVSPINTSATLSGYIVIEYDSDIMDTLTRNPLYSVNKTFALVASDGEVVELCGATSSICNKDKSLLDNEDAVFSDGTYVTFKQSISNSRTGYIRIAREGEDKYLFYSPISSYFANVVMLVDYSDYKISLSSAEKDIRKFLTIIGIIISAIALIIIGIGVFNRTKYHMESEDLQYKADTDQLTDLYNKAATERLIKEYLAGDGKDRISMMFVLDIDNFKKINDTQGHAFGDKVLSSLGHQIKTWFRVNDIIGRIGGDEFIIFVKDIKNPDAIKREGSRIMQFFEGFNVGDYTRYSPTASVGGAVYPNDATDFENLYKSADKAVYKSKREGKNRVSFYGDLDNDEKESAGNSENQEDEEG